MSEARRERASVTHKPSLRAVNKSDTLTRVLARSQYSVNMTPMTLERKTE